MNVLFISIPFYGYIEKIAKAFRKVYKANVDILFLDACEDNAAAVLNKLTDGQYADLTRKKRQNSFYKTRYGKQYDLVFVLVGRGLNIPLFKKFIACQEKAKKILYLWDDAERIDNIKLTVPLFDLVFSFDKSDCDKYGFRFLSLFYCEEYVYKKETKKYDISCIGFWHSDRVYVLNRLLEILEESKYNWYLLLSTAKIHLLKEKILQRKKSEIPDYIMAKQLSIKENAEILKESLATVDIPHESQNGLSMRVFEALAANTKIITTNENIKRYDFYHEDNVCIINRENPKIPKEFLKTPFVPINREIVEKYSIESWVKSIFAD